MEIKFKPVTADVRFAETSGDMNSANFRAPVNILILLLAGFGVIALGFYVYNYFETKKGLSNLSTY